MKMKDNKNGSFNKKNRQDSGNGKNYRKEERRPERRNEVQDEVPEGIVYGRNPVLELLSSGRIPDKLYVASGDREGSITLIVA